MKMMQRIFLLILLCSIAPFAVAQNDLNIAKIFPTFRYWVPYGNQDFTSGLYPSDLELVINDSGIPYIEYNEDTSGLLDVMTLQNGQWVSVGQPEPSNMSYENMGSLALGKNGTPYVAFFGGVQNSSEVQVMKLDAGQWVPVGAPILNAEFNIFSQFVFAISKQGVPFVVYTNPNTYKVYVMKFDGNKWVQLGGNIVHHEDASKYSLAVDSNGAPYLAYDDGASPTDIIKVMKFNGTTWKQDGDDLSVSCSSGIVVGFSFALNSKGVPYIAYQDKEIYNKDAYISVAKLDSKGHWTSAGEADFAKVAAGLWPSLVISPTDVPSVAFVPYQKDRAVSSHVVVMILSDKNTWIPIANINSFSQCYDGWTVSLAFDKNNNPYVAYNDSSLNDELSVEALSN